ncbi:efflux transporter outer membrane subunit [Breoghania sp.]|uniref:efflux transporter outer membrane subunit n=1 Tax=Breoghania sp. TaxID=2065378 RepID=UPI002AAB5334|nr:efflux transporter outer membrane subunit [Breoghania sp.]
MTRLTNSHVVGQSSSCRFPVKLAANRGVRGAGIALALSVLAGCAVGPDYRAPDMLLPTKWAHAGKEHSRDLPKLEAWWTALGDPILNDLVDEAVASNLDVAAAKARIREARASYRQSTGALFPSLNGSASGKRSKSSAGSADAGPGVVGNQFASGFDASWELDIFGANRRAREAARYSADAAEDDLEDTLVTLIGDVATNYIEARGYQARIALASRTAASQNETADLTRKQFEAGGTSGVDVANATGQASSTEASIPTLRISYAAAVHRLSVLLGREPDAVASRMKKPRRIPHPKAPLPAGIPADVLIARPDVRLAERRLAQYTARVGAAEAARYPAISLTGAIGTSAREIGDLGRNSTISWSFGPSLSVPIFNAGKLKAAVEVAEAQRDQYFVAYHAAVLTALEDVENALVSMRQQRIRVGKLSKSVANYRRAVKLSRSLYQTGSSSFLDVLTAERSLYSAEDAMIASQVQIATAYVSLNKALGGGWNGTLDASKKIVEDTNTGPHLAKAK